ncbi:MAG: lipase family protein [Nitriliruptorales bacterium]|nr:lipase family protein [Nitriliruptorales bacterium]
MRVLAVAAVLAGIAGPASGQESPVVPPPEQDPFYDVPEGIEPLAPGTVIDAREIQPLVLGLPMPANGWQVRYRTVDQHGDPSAFIATILTPLTEWAGEGPRPVLVFNAAEAGLGLKCTASYALRAGLQGYPGSGPFVETTAMAAAIERGWTVIAPDFQGPRSEYLGMEGYATGILDAIRAARAFGPAAIDAGAPVGMLGYSISSSAALAAATVPAADAAGITFVGVVAGGTIPDWDETIRLFSGDTFGGALAIILGGLDRSFPNVDVRQLLNDDGNAALDASASDCLGDAVLQHPGASLDAWSAVPDFLAEPAVRKLLDEVSPLTRPGTMSAPLLLYHAAGDTYAPLETVEALAARYCRDVPVQIAVSQVGEHFANALIAHLTTFDWLADRFAGVAPPNECAPTSPADGPDSSHDAEGGVSGGRSELPASGGGGAATILGVALGLLAGSLRRHEVPGTR